MRSYEILTLIICFAALFSYINTKYIKWPPTIGIMALSLLSSVIIIVTVKLFPDQLSSLVATITSIDFYGLLMNCMLGFLLFAGSYHIDAQSLKKEMWSIITLSTVGVLISTFLIGAFLYFLFIAFHLGVAYIYCLLFASLISPTDPIAVLAILKQAEIPKSLEIKIAGESLFNDGVAVVIFLTILEVAQTGVDKLSISDVALLFLREAGGGLIFGFLIGYAGFYAIRSIDKYEVEVLITIAIVMGGYLLAGYLHVSGPLAMVVAGILIANKGKESGISNPSQNYLHKFWELIDNMLNAILFMLIGFEMLVIKIESTVILISVISIVVILFARWVSVAIPVSLLRYKVPFEKGAVAILTWGGLRGGLSVALALALPANMHHDLFLAITYIVVIFSIIVQGLTIGKFYRSISAKKSLS